MHGTGPFGRHTAAHAPVFQACLETKFAGIADTRERAGPSGRTMREAKIVKPCPQCKFDLAEFMKSAKVNIDMAAIIGNLQRAAAARGEAAGAASDDEEDEEAEEEARIAQACAFFSRRDAAALLQEAGGAGPSAAAPAPSRTAPGVDERAKREAAIDSLCEQFPTLDRALIDSIMADQGNDVRDVTVMLRRMSRPEPSRAAKKGAAQEDEAAGAAAAGTKRKR